MELQYLRSILVFFILLLVMYSGCITDQKTNAGTTESQNLQENSDVINPTLSGRPLVIKDIASPLAVQGTRQWLNVVREMQYTINGSVTNNSVTKVQLWIVNGTIVTRIVPVNKDGTFQIVLSPSDTAALSRESSTRIVIQFPSSPDHFSLNWNATTRKITGENGMPERTLSEYKSYDPRNITDYLEEVIPRYGKGESCSIFFLAVEDAWINLDKVKSGPQGSMVVSGNTSLPVGTPISISVRTVNMHPSYPGYDWSHEMADGSAVVASGSYGSNSFINMIDISRLNSGKYHLSVTTRRLGQDDPVRAETSKEIELIEDLPAQPETGNYINWSALSLPVLVVNNTMAPEMLDGEWKIVPPDTRKKNSEVPYGSIIDCGMDGICRIFDPAGIQFLAVYDSNQAHMMEVPEGAAIDQGSVGNVTFIRLHEEVILTQIMERAR
jgi:hypothetical protein